MWQSTKTRKNEGKLLASTLSLSYRYGVLRGVASQLAVMPLTLALVGAVWAHGWDWRLLVLLPLSLLCSMYISMLRLVHHTTRVYEQVNDLYAKHPHWRFTPITTADYLEALYQDAQAPAGGGGAAREQEFAKSVLTSTEFYRGEHLRLVVIETAEETGVGVLATFATLDRAWVFLDGNPRDMRGFEHFKVLHEIGHTDIGGMLVSYVTRGNLTQLSLTLFVMAFMLKWEPATLLVLALYLLVFLSLTKLTLKWLARQMRYMEELYADDFALARCPGHWFEGFSEQDVNDFARAVCGGASPNGAQGEHASPLFDAPLTEEQANWRRIVLDNMLNRKLRGEAYVAKERIPVLSARLVTLLNFCQNLLLAALSVALGLQHAEPTTTRFVVLVVVMLSVAVVGLSSAQLMQALAAHWDANLNAKPLSEATPTEQKTIRYFEKGLRWRERLDARRRRQRWTEEKGLDHDALAAGTTGRVFLAQEVALYAELQTSETYILHAKVIDYAISHVEYVPDSHSLVVVMNDQTRLDLGTKVGEKLTPHFLKADEVRIIRIADGEPVDGVAVPLRRAA